MAVDPILEYHGTDFLRLNPSTILSVAKIDLERRVYNMGMSDGFKHYGFLARHVRQASGPIDLVRRALKQIEHGVNSGKRCTRLLYRHETEMKALVDDR